MRISDWSSDVCSSDLGLPPQQIIFRSFLAAPPPAAWTPPMSASPNVDPAFTRRLYGRRQGHALRQGQATLVEELLPQVAVPEEGALTAEHLFGSARPMQFEIGFGGGEHMAAQAKAHPGHGFIGCEQIGRAHV